MNGEADVKLMRVIVLAIAAALAQSARAAEPMYSAAVEKAAAPESIAEPIRKQLDGNALVVRDKTEVIMRIWFRSVIPVKASAEQFQNGLTYREIPEGTLVGALEFPHAFTDFRKQDLPAGVYTLRFAVQPDIGDHTGTSPNPEFCLLCRAADDVTDDPVDKKKLIELSSKVNEGRHPAVLLLWPNNGSDGTVKTLEKGNGVVVATIRRPVASEDAKASLGFAVTVAGVRKE